MDRPKRKMLLETDVQQNADNSQDEELEINNESEITLEPKTKKVRVQKDKLEPSEDEDILMNEKSISNIDLSEIEATKNALLNQLKRIPPVDLQQQTDSLSQILKNSISLGHGNSVLLLGPNNSGKTLVVDHVLASFPPNSFSVIRLNGLMHTDDKLALTSITRQLNLQAEILVDLPGSFSDKLAYVLGSLDNGDSATIPIVFVLDGLDLFATHPKQLLLYNLLDMSQNAQTPVIVVGISSRLDTLASLEKRVRSRFSHRIIHFYLSKTIESFTEIAKHALAIQESNTTINSNYKFQFNSSLKEFFKSKSVCNTIDELFSLSKDVTTLLQLCINTIHNLNPENPFPNPNIFTFSATLYQQDQQIMTLNELSLLETCLVIAIKNVLRSQHESFNFEMVYEEYREFVRRVITLGRGVGQINFTKKVALNAFEQLQAIGILKPTTGVGSQCPKEYRMVKSLVTRSQIVNAFAHSSQHLPLNVVNWYIMFNL
ncbi:origin recognition complex subunit 4 C-terminus-domain-containing protein [Globomyces pollinis-pini]|nr:origin recognition complex subunit 4 C-terminus-domain-containing protein [Globomyces pollinis-pini]